MWDSSLAEDKVVINWMVYIIEYITSLKNDIPEESINGINSRQGVS